ncbi:unnamed protein product [Musa acuminata var. zebrina]
MLHLNGTAALLSLLLFFDLLGKPSFGKHKRPGQSEISRRASEAVFMRPTGKYMRCLQFSISKSSNFISFGSPLGRVWSSGQCLMAKYNRPVGSQSSGNDNN